MLPRKARLLALRWFKRVTRSTSMPQRCSIAADDTPPTNERRSATANDADELASSLRNAT
jgi:hypothetical protein